jgi:hydrogenase maturation protease
MNGDQATTVPRRVLVVGLGNPDRGDDGIGRQVIQDLDGRLPPDVSVLARSGDLLSLVEDWDGFDALVCVDAAAGTEAPGRVHRFDLATHALPREASFASSHDVGLAEAVELARALGTAPGDIVVYAVEGACFECGASLTPDVAAVRHDVADLVIAEVNRLRQ